MVDKFTFSSAGEAQEVEFALARHGWTHALLKKATSGDYFGLFREALEGRAEICRIERLADGGKKIFSVWKTFIVGGKSVRQMLTEMENGGFHISDRVEDIVGKLAFKTSAEPHEVSFVRVKVADLGFTKPPTTTEIFARAKEQGLDPCEAEDGLYIRFAHNDQPCGNWFWVAMEPIVGSDGSPRVLSVGRDGGGERWLSAPCADHGDRWSLELGIVFRLRK